MTDLSKLKPELKKVDMLASGFTGSQDPRFHGVKFDVPAKLVANTKSEPALQNLYSKGPLKFEGTGRVCAECTHFYPDPKIENTKQGRCKARGYMRVSEDTPADEKHNWTDPASGIWFSTFPSCPLFSSRERLSLH
jgi:hypothetical protein